MSDFEDGILKKLTNAKVARELADSFEEEAVKDIARKASEQSQEYPDPHRKSYVNIGDSHFVSILFLDIVGYSKLPQDDLQRDAIDSLNAIVRAVLLAVGCDLDQVVCLPTGDGMCLCFIQNPHGPLMVASGIQKALIKENRKLQKRKKPKLELRMGIHCGHVLRVTDLKGSYNLAGAAINISQRAMSCGDEGHILCTAQAFDEFKKMSDYKKDLIPIKPEFRVKHGVELTLYNYVRPKDGVGNAADPHRD